MVSVTIPPEWPKQRESDVNTKARKEDGAWLVRRSEEWRQIAIVALYLLCLGGMYFSPSWRNPFVFVLACGLSFLNAVVVHNHLHQGVFRSKEANLWFRRVLSFGNLYPASANIPAHNLIHHQFEDDGDWDWADPRIVDFKWNLANLVHFPNVAGPRTFNGVTRWAKCARYPGFEKQYRSEMAFAFGLTALLLAWDPFTTIFFIVIPQLYGARCILRINIIQHDRTDISTQWNHSRNFVGKFFNYIMCNNGFHTIHHNRATTHWADLREAHEQIAKPRMHSSLDEGSMVFYLLRTYLFSWRKPPVVDLASAEKNSSRLSIPSREERTVQAHQFAEFETTAG